MNISREKFAKAARGDFEFVRETRYLNGLVKLDFGDGDVWSLSFDEGSLSSVEDGGSIPDGDCKIIVGGRSEQWDALLMDKPRPFYQCIQSAVVKHHMTLSDTSETFAYLPALNRMTTLLRRLKSGGN